MDGDMSIIASATHSCANLRSSETHEYLWVQYTTQSITGLLRTALRALRHAHRRPGPNGHLAGVLLLRPDGRGRPCRFHHGHDLAARRRAG